MQRWWFADDKAQFEPDPTPETSTQESTESVVEIKEWTFKVVVNIELLPREQIAVTGETKYLGNWLPAHCLLLHQDGKKT